MRLAILLVTLSFTGLIAAVVSHIHPTPLVRTQPTLDAATKAHLGRVWIVQVDPRGRILQNKQPPTPGELAQNDGKVPQVTVTRVNYITDTFAVEPDLTLATLVAKQIPPAPVSQKLGRIVQVKDGKVEGVPIDLDAALLGKHELEDLSTLYSACPSTRKWMKTIDGDYPPELEQRLEALYKTADEAVTTGCNKRGRF